MPGITPRSASKRRWISMAFSALVRPFSPTSRRRQKTMWMNMAAQCTATGG
jgi:hypothetical protein